MKQERMKILEMLEAGKITAEEATNLLEAMKSPGYEPEGFRAFVVDDDRLGRFTRDFGSRVESLYKEVEPKIKKASQTVLEKTAAVFDEISKSLNESLENARSMAKDAQEECSCCCCEGEEAKAEEEPCCCCEAEEAKAEDKPCECESDCECKEN